ncbi:hypothetical protein GCM10011519_22940 [Marmoricola endophyticus]|uniref:Uncharacterized protein n=1 Tax=Marmoricola endophyticus TaxID=2040280 RepID=A0A917F4V5_9ACTN|nr:hypothetical protein GCM10011519_22940 [Marmoricola endophyticus]
MDGTILATQPPATAPQRHFGTFGASHLCLIRPAADLQITSIEIGSGTPDPKLVTPYLRVIDPHPSAAAYPDPADGTFDTALAKVGKPSLNQKESPALLGRFLEPPESKHLRIPTCRQSESAWAAISERRQTRWPGVDLMAVVQSDAGGAVANGIVVNYTLNGTRHVLKRSVDFVVCGEETRSLQSC